VIYEISMRRYMADAAFGGPQWFQGWGRAAAIRRSWSTGPPGSGCRLSSGT